MAVFTTETRLSERDAKDIIAYTRDYVYDYGVIQRYVWHRICQNKGKTDKSKLNTEVQQKFSVTKRTANSVIFNMQGRYRALKELKKTEKYQLKSKIEHLEKKAEKLSDTVNVLKDKADQNELSEKQLVSYRNLKKKLYFLHQKIQKKKDILFQLEKDMVDGNYSLGFGGRRTFDNQYRLSENGFKSHEGWYNDYVKHRDCNIFYLGSKDETAGNQMFQLLENAQGSYDIKIRKDAKYATDKTDRYVTGKCSFKYLNGEIRMSLKDKPISYRIKIRGQKVYLQAIVQIDAVSVPATTLFDGAIGLDFNSGHIDLSETDNKGNLVSMKVFPLVYHETGRKAENEMRQTVSEIGRYALMTGKSIVKEDLSFKKTKAATDTNKNKAGYNRMIHTLDYSRYEDCLQNMTARKGIDLIEVNPAYTSSIAKAKYCGTRKIPIHNGAAYVIARRGQGFVA